MESKVFMKLVILCTLIFIFLPPTAQAEKSGKELLDSCKSGLTFKERRRNNEDLEVQDLSAFSCIGFLNGVISVNLIFNEVPGRKKYICFPKEANILHAMLAIVNFFRE